MSNLPSTFLVDETDGELDDPQIHLQRNVRVGLIVIAALVFAVFALAALIGVNGAVIGQGEVTVESRIKKIAHPTGGVIAELYVREGTKVRRGDPLMRLDSTVSGVNANMSGQSFQQLLAAKARLLAERDSSPSIAFPEELTTNPDAAASQAIAEASRLFALRRTSRNNEQAQIGERVRQTQLQIESLESQARAARSQSTLIRPELDGLRSLREKGLVTINRLNQMERTAIELEGAAASYSSQIAQARARIAEIRQSSFQLDQDARTQAGVELNQIVAALADQKVKSVAAKDVFDRAILRAPYDGIVDKLAYSTIGGVVPPAQTIMEVVPSNDNLTIEVKVSPYDIDQMRIDQPAILRFSAFSAQTTPELNGKVAHISAERITDDRTGTSYYKATIEVGDKEMARLAGLKLVPGMPVEAFIQTGRRSLLSYITKPLRDQFSRAFREN